LRSWECKKSGDLVIAHDRVSEKTLVEPCAQMKRNGYAIIPEVLNCTEAEELLSKLEASQLRRSRAGVRHLLGHPVVSAVANDPRLLGLAQEILGDQAFPFRATLFDKSPDANWLITWHQDTAVPLREKVDAAGWGPWSVKEGVIYAHAPAAALERVVALRLHLDDSTAANGPLRIIPETHCRGVLSDSAVETIVAQEPGVTCMVEKGGIIAMKPLAIHASSKSQAESPRRVLHIEYATNTAVSAPLQLAIA
jgi:ectoine hydroxylase-related dioxygenase (phytanoyl-CoA dioxygenase family)